MTANPHPAAFNAIALIGRNDDSRVADSMLNLAGYLHERGIEILVEPTVGLDFAGIKVIRLEDQQIAARAQLVIAIGGDGTMLHAARLVASRSVPLLGVNRGRLGFLADVSPDDLQACLDDVLAGRFLQDSRTLLDAQLGSAPEFPSSARLTALNDVVIQKGEIGRMLELETWIDGRYVNTHSGDGLVIATATGSTAYALSCGGPIVHPELDILVLAPICPHTLSDRPVIIPAGARIEIRLTERRGAHAQVICDGMPLGTLEPARHLIVTPSANKITLLHPPGYDYYKLLRSKLYWGSSRRESGARAASRPARDGRLDAADDLLSDKEE